MLIITTGACVNQRHSEEKDCMIQLHAVGSTTAEFVGSLSESASLDDDITTDDDNEANHLLEDEENNIVDKVPL